MWELMSWIVAEFAPGQLEFDVLGVVRVKVLMCWKGGLDEA